MQHQNQTLHYLTSLPAKDILCAEKCGSLWVTSGFKDTIVACQAGQDGPLWSLSAKQHPATGSVYMRCQQGVLLAVTNQPDNIRQRILKGIDVATGEVRWERMLNWKRGHNHGGIVTSTDTVYICEPQGKQFDLVALNINDGHELKRVNNIHIQNAGANTISFQTMAIVGEWLYYCQADQGLFRLHLDKETSTPEQLTDNTAEMLAVNATQVFCITGAFNQLCIAFDASSGKEINHIALPKMIAENIQATDEHQFVVVSGSSKHGLAVLDLNEPSVVSQIGRKESWEVGNVAWVEDSIVAIIETENGMQVSQFSLDGDILVEAIVDGYPYNGLIYKDQQLLIDTTDGIQLFTTSQEVSIITEVAKPILAIPPIKNEQTAIVEATPSRIDIAFAELTQLFVQMLADAHNEQDDTQSRKLFNNALNAFYNEFEEANLASVAQNLTQLGLSYDEAMQAILINQ